MSTREGRLAAAVLALVVPCSTPGPVEAQEGAHARRPVEVSYIGEEGLYLSVGADDGAVQGDSVDIYADESSPNRIGRVVFTAVTRKRSIAGVVEAARRVRRGDVLFIPLRATPAVSSEPAPDPMFGAPPERAERTFAAAARPRISGHVSLDLDARETRTSWSGDLFGETRRRFATPTTRLSFAASGLPGDVTVHANLRASYRYADIAAAPPPASVRAYQLAAVKSFQRVPLEVRLGRFTNPHESYSAYWDGALLRLGRPAGAGLGIAGGFEPALHNEGFSTTVPKLTAFADFARRGSGWRYETDVSFHYLRPDGGAARSYVGWSQRLSLGRMTVGQRIRIDGAAGSGQWSVSDVRLRLGVGIAGPLRLRGTYARSRPELSYLLPVSSEAIAPPPRDDMTAGLDLLGRVGSLSIDGGRSTREGLDTALSISGSGALALGDARLLLSGRRWTRGSVASFSVAPGLWMRVGRTDWRTGYRFYRTETASSAYTTQAAETFVGLAITHALRVSLRGEYQWGPSVRGVRMQVGFRHGF